MRIKTSYIVATVLWVVFALMVILYNVIHDDISSGELTSLIFTAVGVFITLISIAISDRKKLKYEGKIICWINKTDIINVNNDILTPIGVYTKITFKIDNYAKHDIKSLLVNIRIPSNIYYRAPNTGEFLTSFEFKNTIMLSSSKMKYLGSTNGDSDLILEQYFNFDAWSDNRVVFVTIAGENIIPTTFNIDSVKKEELKKSNSNNPVKLTQV